MGKRFTDSDKYKDPWFRKLPPALKALWYFLLDSCDYVGVWKVDFEEAEHLIGCPVPWPDALPQFDGRVVAIDGGKKWMVAKFIPFQYGPLGSSFMHGNIVRGLKAHGIDPAPFLSQGLPKAYPSLDQGLSKGCSTLKEKEKDREKDSISGESEGAPSSRHSPHEDVWKPEILKAGGKIYGRDGALSWQGVINAFPLPKIIAMMARMAPAEAADPIRVRDRLWSERRQAAEVTRPKKGSAEDDAEQQARWSAAQAQKRANEAAYVTMSYIVTNLSYDENAALRERVRQHPNGGMALEWMAAGKRPTDLMVGSILRAFPELRKIVALGAVDR